MLAHSTSPSLTNLSKQLLEAARNGNDNDVRSLMTQGAPFTPDWLGTSPLHLSCMNGHVSTTQILARAGVSWDGRTKADKTPMHLAAQNGHREIVAFLIKLGADINATDMLQMTPVHWAVVEEHFLVVKLLVENHADLTIKNKFDRTPIASAQDACHFHIVEYLKTSQNHQTYEDSNTPTSSVTDPSPQSVLASLAALSGSSTITDSLPWLHQDVPSVASGASVLLEGANMITLTEAGKLALQAWSNLYEDEPTKDVEKPQTDASATDVQDGLQKHVLSLTLANQMLNAPTSNFGSSSQPFTFVVSPVSGKTKPTDQKLPPNRRKRKLSTPEQAKRSDDSEAGPAPSIEQQKQLQRHLAAAQSEVAVYREKLQMKEQEAHIWRKRLESFQQNRT